MPIVNVKKTRTILVAPLHWGLGHATRCIPIINGLLAQNYKVLLGSDGAALSLLRKEFPQLPWVELPGYNISYSKKAGHFKWKLMTAIPRLQKTIQKEKQFVKDLVVQGKIDGIISDNRFGVRNKQVPSVFVTHQLNVLSGKTSFISSKLHQKIIEKFNECWVPDVNGPINLSGKLGHPKKTSLPIKYIGPLSRMKKENLPIKYDVLALLSGPEPQRTLLEEKVTALFLENLDKKYLLVRGVIEEQSSTKIRENVTIVNFMQTEELQNAINESAMVLARSGYTTLMDLAALEKPAFFIPTPEQYEQIYLAKQLKNNGVAPSCGQEKFKLKKLKEIPLYKGLKAFQTDIDYAELFRLFERK